MGEREHARRHRELVPISGPELCAHETRAHVGEIAFEHALDALQIALVVAGVRLGGAIGFDPHDGAPCVRLDAISVVGDQRTRAIRQHEHARIVPVRDPVAALKSVALRGARLVKPDRHVGIGDLVPQERMLHVRVVRTRGLALRTLAFPLAQLFRRDHAGGGEIVRAERREFVQLRRLPAHRRRLPAPLEREPRDQVVLRHAQQQPIRLLAHVERLQVPAVHPLVVEQLVQQAEDARRAPELTLRFAWRAELPPAACARLRRFHPLIVPAACRPSVQGGLRNGGIGGSRKRGRRWPPAIMAR